MVQLIISVICFFGAKISSAAAVFHFKQPLIPKNSWLVYSSVLACMIVITLILSRRHKLNPSPKSECQLIEKKFLSNKTIIYIVDYQQQRFLLADNQQAIALHPLKPKGQI
jgi:hypothetical protein